jgi:uncharacterized phiE125 gp8 family phage protein
MEVLQAIAGTRPLPVEIGDAKAHLRVDFGADDTAIMGLIDAARDYLETITSRSFIHQQFKLIRDCWPPCGTLDLPRPPLVSVASIEYYAEDATILTTMPTTDYHVVTDDVIDGSIVLAKDVEWPDLETRPDAVQITFTAGFGATSTVLPARIKQAVLLVVGHWYANREAASERAVREIEQGLQALLASLWTGNVAGARV